MGTLKQEALDYEPKQVKNIAELDVVDVGLDVLEDNEAEFPYKYIVKENERYRVPNTVLEQLKTFVQANPKMTKFKVVKTGEGLKTKYQVVPID